MKKEFYVGDTVIYNGYNKKIGTGTRGTVIDTRDQSISNCLIAVRFEGREGILSDLSGRDKTSASLWCNENSLILSEDADKPWMESARGEDILGIL